MANKVMIVGTGNVGMSYGYALVHQRTNVNELIAELKEQDLSQTISNSYRNWHNAQVTHRTMCRKWCIP